MQTFARVIVLLLLLSANIRAYAGYVSPSGLKPGDTFRLVFVTSGTINALSSDIGVYDKFVSDAAATAGLSTIYGANVQWSAIASTTSVYAKSRFSLTDAQIFRLDGERVAIDLSSLWANDLAIPINIDETGNTRNVRVYTGTSQNVHSFPTSVLGSVSPPQTIIGFSGARNSFWLEESQWSQQSTKHSLYAISEELTFPATPVPEPACSTAFSGLAAFAIFAKYRKRGNRLLLF
jgi:hypothetical protein